MTARLRALDPVLDELRDWSPVYRRWSEHPCRGAGPDLAPWSEADEQRVGRLRELAGGGLADLAERLGRFGSGIGEVGSAVRAVAFTTGLPEQAADRCAVVARALEEHAERGASLARAVHRVADGVDAQLDALVRAVLREADVLGSATRYASVGLVQQEIDLADASVGGAAEPDRWRPLDELVDAYGAVLDAVRSGLATFGRWLDDEVGTGEEPVDPADPVWVWRRWRAIPLDDDIEPGSGPRLPGMEGSWADPATGVRLPRMPGLPR